MSRRFRNYETIKYPKKICICKQSSTESVNLSINLLLIAQRLVFETVCSAREYIAHDIAEVFYYKYPMNYKSNSSDEAHSDSQSSSASSTKSTFSNEQIMMAAGATVAAANVAPPNAGGTGEKQYFDYNDDLSWIAHSIMTEAHRGDARHPDDIEWCTIERFNIRDVASQIRDYIELWSLMPGTKCTLITKDEVRALKNKGFRYYVDALFSNPTPRCPNPLAVAKVHFYIHVPELMPEYYPVMVTYNFEGFKSIYYALGYRQMRSLEFQRFFIDTILHMKMSFYAEIFECRFADTQLFEEEEAEEEEGLVTEFRDLLEYECEAEIYAETEEGIECCDITTGLEMSVSENRNLNL